MKKRKQDSVFVASSAVLLSLAGLASGATEYPDTLWIPVIFYDYWVDNNLTNPDFESAAATAAAFTGMVTATLDQQKKPVPTALACPTNPPLACHLNEWFRASGIGGSDATCLFQCDSVTNPRVQRWFWTTSTGGPLRNYQGRVGEYIGPNYDSTYDMRNVIIYDSLPFRHLGRTNPDLMGMYEYDNSSFFRLDNRGYGEQPAGTGHNFGFAMEMHTTFRYRPGLTFNFRGDDDVWAFVNNQLVMDIGGRHGPLPGSFNLDNVAGLVLDSSYTFDFFYTERYITGSNIRITSNIITAQPSKLTLTVTDITICAGELTTIKGLVTDQFGRVYQEQADSIVWTIDPATRQPGDTILITQGDSTIFTGTAAYRKAGIIGYVKNSNPSMRDTGWVYIIPNLDVSIDLVVMSEQPLADAQLLPLILYNTATPPLTVFIDSASSKMYLYAILRDRFGNFIQFAGNVTWMSLNPDIVTVASAPGKCYEGILARAPGAIHGSTKIIVSAAGFQSDTVSVILRQSTMAADGRAAHPPASHPVICEKGTVKIHLPSIGMRVNVFSLTGTLVRSRTTKGTNLSISLPKGVFILTLQSPGSDRTHYKRIIVH